MTQVVLKNINLTRGTTAILRDVDLTIEAGEFCVFVGPSGCGKSTLLRLIAGLEEDADGEIEIDGRPIGSVPGAQRNIAMVFQGYALYPHMTVFENMAFGLRQAGLPRVEIETRVTQAARILQLDALLGRKPKALSGGQRQRVAIGRAIVKKPKVFLFDEPLSNLDASLRIETRVEIAKLHREMNSASMLYVTHDQVEALTLADKIVLLRPVAGTEGLPSIVQVGRPLDLYHHPADLFAARFIGAPTMNLLDARVRALADHRVVFDLQGQRLHAEVDAQGLAVGDMITVGIRPEHVTVGSGGLHAVITHIEALGEHSVLYLNMPGVDAPLVAKTTDERQRVGDKVALGFAPEALHVFREDGIAMPRTRRVTIDT
jgi:multiple sugar transport system ATP-binding protein